MKLWFSADMHHGHRRIIEYENRPFTGLDDMHEVMCSRFNRVTVPGDVLYHLGDFCFYNAGSQGQGQSLSPAGYEAMIACRIFHIRGNHDTKGIARHAPDYAVINYSGYRILMVHDPEVAFVNPLFLTQSVDLVLCGHVHSKWKSRFLAPQADTPRIPFVNVGVDVWDYAPVSMKQIIGEVTKCRRAC